MSAVEALLYCLLLTELFSPGSSCQTADLASAGVQTVLRVTLLRERYGCFCRMQLTRQHSSVPVNAVSLLGSWLRCRCSAVSALSASILPVEKRKARPQNRHSKLTRRTELQLHVGGVCARRFRLSPRGGCRDWRSHLQPSQLSLLGCIGVLTSLKFYISEETGATVAPVVIFHSKPSVGVFWQEVFTSHRSAVTERFFAGSMSRTLL